jgi:hypothetical protein
MNVVVFPVVIDRRFKMKNALFVHFLTLGLYTSNAMALCMDPLSHKASLTKLVPEAYYVWDLLGSRMERS